MKELTVIVLLSAAIAGVMAAPAEKNVDAGIDHVTLFHSGAQVMRSSKPVSLEKGQTLVIIDGLEQNLVENSIRVGLDGNGKILSVVKRMDYLELVTTNQKIADLELKLEQLQNEKEELQLGIRVFDLEKTLLINNMKLGSEQQGVQISELREASDFYRSRLTEIEKGFLSGNRTIKDLELEIAGIRKQLSDLNYQKNKPSSTLEVTVEMTASGNTRLVMDYYVPEARWSPLYDIRVDEIGEPVAIIRKASASQSTGVDWNNVKVTFSTGNPRERATKPELIPWYLREIRPEPTITLRGIDDQAAARPTVKKSAVTENVAMEEGMDMDYSISSSMPVVITGAKNSLLEFTLASPASIPSDNKEYTLVIGSVEVDAAYEYHCVPKLDPSAYLVAMVADRNRYNLVNGAANIYYEGMFVGKTYINAASTYDTMQISLGRDRDIMVERKQLEEFSSDRLIGSNRTIEFAFENIIRNGKSREIIMIVEDQYPVSTMKDIEVNAKEHGSGKWDKITGKVSWRVPVKPGETVKLPLNYAVKYPSEMQINL
ncbi:MAG: mucoidy inhibitor MuiA family protein [Bacteroidales bacterium]|nr:mucoidy inhibitor MuiA family protein [Bacteroidales bacterium]